MSKTNEQILATFKKANKAARERMAIKSGFKTAEEYKLHLEGKNELKGTVSKTKTKQAKNTPSDYLEGRALDMVIGFDTTGSMDAYLADVRKQVEQVLNDMFDKNKDIRVKVVAFGDYCDMIDKNTFGNAYQVSEMSTDRNALINFVKNAKRTSGCDGDEFYELVIKKVVEETEWRPEAEKSFLLIGDANPHEVGYSYRDLVEKNTIDWRKECESAASKGIKIDTLSIHGNDFYKNVSLLTNGLNIPFKKANNVSEVIRGLSYARSGSEVAFSTQFAAATASGDEELIGAYKSMSTLL